MSDSPREYAVMSLGLAVLGTVFGAVLFTLGMRQWREAIPAALVLAVFEGALRKWVLPDYGQFIYLTKDILLLGAYAGFFLPRVLRHQPLALRHPATRPLVLLGLVAMLELANPLLPNLAIGLFGLKAYLVYAPLLYLVPHAFPETSGLRRFLMTFVLLAFVPLALGIVQFWAPPDSVLNRYAWEEEPLGIATFGESGKVRITGTFSYNAGHGNYLTLIALVGVALMGVERGRRQRLTIGAVLALTVANLFMTGSRGPFLVLGVTVPALLVLAGFTPRRLTLARAAVPGVAVLATVVLAVNLFPDAVAAFRERVEANEDVPDRVLGIVREPLWALGEAGAIGYGIGTTHQAAVFLGGGGTEVPPAEGEWERIILEVGPVGFVLVILTRLFVIARTWQAWRGTPEGDSRALLAAALMFVLLSFPGNIVFNHTAAIFYWFMAGVALVPGGSPVRRLQVDSERHPRPFSRPWSRQSHSMSTRR
jgi:hypothetical protein